MRGQHDRPHPQRVRERAAEERPCSTVRQQGELPRVESPRHAHALERSRHRRGRHRDDPRRDGVRLAPHRGPERRDRALGRGGVEPQLVRERAPGVEPAEHEAGVRDSGPISAATVAGRPRHGSRALRTDLERAALVHPGDAPASRAHRLDEDRRERERYPRDRPCPFGERLGGGHETRVRARPPHVDGEQIAHADRRADEPCADHATRRPRQGERRGTTRGGRRRQAAAARRHDAEPADAALTHRRFQAGQVGRNPWP